MIRKSVREFPLDKHKKISKKLITLDAQCHELLADVRAIKKPTNEILKAIYWLNRVRLTLSSQLEKDFPEKYHASIYSPAETVPTPAPEPMSIPSPITETISATATEPTLQERY